MSFAFFFPGQGSQSLHMMDGFDGVSVVKNTFDEASAALGQDLWAMMNGEDAEPLYKFLKEQKGFAGWDMSHRIAPILHEKLSQEDPDYQQKPDIKWNFTKFLINKKGQVVARFEPTESIANIAKQIETLL